MIAGQKLKYALISGRACFPVFTMAQWAHLSSAARLPCRRRFIPRGSTAFLLRGDTFRIMRIICPRCKRRLKICGRNPSRWTAGRYHRINLLKLISSQSFTNFINFVWRDICLKPYFVIRKNQIKIVVSPRSKIVSLK